MSKFLNISTDTTLGGNSPSDEIVSSQKAIKDYVDSHGGGGSTAIDNLSITQNSSSQIQTVGVINSRDSSTAVKTWTGTKAQYDAIVTKDPNTLYNITDDTDVTDIRALGQLVESTIPLVDAGLHLLDGSVIAYGSYKAFVDYIAGLVTDYPDLFTTEANWQSSVSTYGVCGKFVYDSVNNTVRLPKITGFTEGTIDPTVLGDLTEAGLPNIEGSVNSALNYFRDGRNLNANGAFGGTVPSSSNVDGSSNGSDCCVKSTITFDASRSSSIYGNSTTVQPQSIKVLYYICIATYPKTQIEVDIDEIATDLNGKADTDLSNMNPTQTVKNTIVGWGMPDYANAVEINVTTSEQSYTCPKDGFVIFSAGGFNGSYGYLKINDVFITNASTTGNSYVTNVFASAPVSKNDVCKFKTGYDSSTLGLQAFKFFPLKGAN